MHIVVVGGGVAGASVAFAVARRGASVTVVDAEHIGRATAAGAGIVQPWGSAATGAVYDLYAAGAAHYPVLIDQLAATGVADIGFRRSGGLVVHHDPTVVGEVEQRVRSRIAAAPLAGTIDRLSAEEVRAHFPPLAPELEGIHISGGARVDGRKLCAGLLTAVERLGGDVRTGQTATFRAGGVAGGTGRGSPTLHVDGEPLGADAIVLAGGAWTPPLLLALGATPVDVAPQRGQIVHLRLDGTDTAGWPTVSPIGADHYMVAFDGGRIVAGATRESEAGFDPRVTAAGQAHVLANALLLAPGLHGATVIETRVGLRPLAPDGLPRVGRVDAPGSVHVVTGFGAIGLTVAPFVGDAVAESLVSGRPIPALAAFGLVTGG